jgi:integrase
MARIVISDPIDVNGKRVDGFPVLVLSNHQPCMITMSYCIHLLRHERLAISTIKTYVGHLKDFYCQLEVDAELTIDDLDEGWLQAYYESILNREIDGSVVNNTEKYASQILATVIRFLYWLSQKSHVRAGLIGIGNDFRISITKDSKNKIQHPLIREPREDVSLSAPRLSWINTVIQFGPKDPLSHGRFELMVKWVIDAGLRGMEICALKIDQLPSRTLAENAALHKKLVKMQLKTTKGGKPQPIDLSPQLLIDTWDYIDQVRKQFLTKLKTKHRNSGKLITDLQYIFISTGSLQKPSPRGFSNAVRDSFLRAVRAGRLTIEQRVWAHGLRHYKLTADAIRADQKNIRNPEEFLRQRARHKSVDTLRRYTTNRHNEAFND